MPPYHNTHETTEFCTLVNQKMCCICSSINVHTARPMELLFLWSTVMSSTVLGVSSMPLWDWSSTLSISSWPPGFLATSRTPGRGTRQDRSVNERVWPLKEGLVMVQLAVSHSGLRVHVISITLRTSCSNPLHVSAFGPGQEQKKKVAI